VNERYMDMISGEFAYDPVRLPVEQDPTQALYNRKTLESIWESKHEAQNPYTRQWFDLRSAIPQTELRREMEHYIQLHKTHSDAGELDVIAEYNVILDEEKMKQHLKMLDYISERLMGEKEYWVKIWKKINLIRLCCQFHDQNIETFRYLHGFRYFNRLINCLLEIASSEKDTRELRYLDVCKETVRAIDVIGLRPSDIIVGFTPTLKLILMLVIINNHSTGFMKFQSVVLRILCKTFGQMAMNSLLGDHANYFALIKCAGLTVAMNRLSSVHAKDISSEDLNHGIGILQAFWTASLDKNFFCKYLQLLSNAVVICIAREIPQRSHEIGGFTEGQVLEAQVQAWHNSKALEKGLWVIKDILIQGGPLSQFFQDFRGSSLVTEIGCMFQRFTQVQKEDKNDSVICPKGCRTFDCVYIRIAQLALDINATLNTLYRITTEI